MADSRSSLMQHRRLGLLLLSLSVALLVFGARARDGWHTYTQPDGTTVTVRLCGDEWLHYYQSPDGTLLERRSDDSFAPFNPEEATRAGIRRADAERHRLRGHHYTGDYRGLVVLVSFADRDFMDDDPKQVWGEFLNRQGFSGYGAQGSASDYFAAQSEGQFRLTFDLVGPVRMPKGCTDYGQYGSGMIRAAITAVADSVDLSPYDWDGDGVLEQFFVLYAGFGSNENSELTAGCIWPHQWSVASLRLGDFTVSDYACCNEIWTDSTYTGIGTFCHEFSHIMGLPDLYDIHPEDASPNGGITDEWDLMDGGNYAHDGWGPPAYSGYERAFCGWLTPTVLDEPASVDALAPLTEGGEVYKIVNDAHPDEFYILENRQRVGWDSYLPGHGLLITHIDYNDWAWSSNRVNDDLTHLRQVPFAANDSLFEYYYHKEPLARLAYPCGDRDSLTDYSSPAATLYNAAPDGRLLMGKPVTDIRERDGLVSFRFMADGTSAIRPVTALGSAPARLYDLQGRPASLSRHPGQLYIRRDRHRDTTRKTFYR